MTKTDFDIQTEVMRKFNYTVKQKSSSDFLELLLFYKVI